MERTAATAGVRAIAQAARQLGIETDAVLRAHGVAPADLDDPDGRVPMEVSSALVERAVARGVRDFGLRVGGSGQWGFALEFLARASPTLGEALSRMVKYARTVADTVDVELTVEGDRVRLGGTFPKERDPGLDPAIVRQDVDVWLAAFVSLGRAITGVQWAPREVRVTYPEPEDTASLDVFYAAPIRYGTGRSELVLDRSLLDTPVLSADTQLATILERHCDELLAELPSPGSFCSQVRRALVAELPAGDPGLAAVADRLGTSARTVQRRLADERASLKQLLDDTRRELALRYLREQDLAITETALLLGYSDTSAFQRAFKRWTGKTPAEHRRDARR